MARYYGNLRFAMFTVFTAIIGGLLAIETEKVGSVLQGCTVLWFRTVAALLAFLFTISQWRVRTLVNFYQEEANRFTKRFGVLEFNLPGGHSRWKWLAGAAMAAPFAIALLFWLVIILQFGTEKITSH
jgi:hypothetical protein